MDLRHAYRLGRGFQYLKRLEEGELIHGELRIINSMERILKTLKKEKIDPNTQKDLAETIQLLKKKYKSDNILSDRLSESDRILLKEKGKIWINRVEKIIGTMDMIQVCKSGTISCEKLKIGSKSFFEKEIWLKIPKRTRRDLDDACKCLLIELWTPSAMISLRACEDVIRQYYKHVTSKNPKKKSWNNVIQELEQNPNSDKRFLGYLDYFREIRNETEHPEKRFKMKEAERIFNETVNLIVTVEKLM